MKRFFLFSVLGLVILLGGILKTAQAAPTNEIYAVVWGPHNVIADFDNSAMIIVYKVGFISSSGIDIGQEIEVKVFPGENANAITIKLNNAVRALALSNGYPNLQIQAVTPTISRVNIN